MSGLIEKIMNLQLLQAVRNAIHWWLDELQSIFAFGKSEADGAQSYVSLSLDNASVSARLVDGESDVDLLPITIEELEAGKLNDKIVDFSTDSTLNYLLLSNKDVIKTQIHLPSATEENLRSVLGFEMDRHTPFSADAVYFGFELIARDAKSITIELIVVPRSAVDPTLNALKSAGLHIDFMLMQEDAQRQGAALATRNLLPVEQLRRKSRSGPQASTRNWRIAAVVAVLVYFLPILTLTFYNGMLERKLEVRMADSAELVAGRQRLLEILEPSKFFASLRNKTPRAVDILNDLSRLLPDDTWVSGLHIENDKILFDGESSDAAALIAIVEESSYLVDSKFASPVTRNPTTGKNRYSIEARVSAGVANE